MTSINNKSSFIPAQGIKNAIILLLSFSVLGILCIYLSTITAKPETPYFERHKLPKDMIIQSGSPIQRIRIPILLYHYVENIHDKRDKMRTALNVTPDLFEDQIKTLKHDGYTFLWVSDIAEILDGKRLMPPKPIAITIDDGHWDLYTDILPILEKYQVRATAYIISGFIGGPDFLSSSQLSLVIKSGLIEIGAHTMHHIELGGKLLPIVAYEVEQSKMTLEKVYNIPVSTFAYPSGSFDKQAANAVASAGYKAAVSTLEGIDQSQDNRYFLSRIRPGNRVGSELLGYIQNQYAGRWKFRTIAGINQ